MPTPRLCNPSPFKAQFRRDVKERKERRYCFILGAGASVSSGIPSGKTLAATWLREFYERECPVSTPGEKAESTDSCRYSDCSIKGVDPANPGAHYAQLFLARFPGNDPEGQRFIQEAVRGSRPDQPNLPSIGYAYLALLLRELASNVVITTNFDNLAADALLLFSGSLPRIVGHERVASFAGLRDGQPLIAKIHGDVGFTTANKPDEVASLAAEWHSPLREIMRNHIPIVIGYEGNDGSLMEFLSTGLIDGGGSLLKSGLYWCYRAAEGRDWKTRVAENPRLKRLTEAHQVYFVPIADFDLWMMELGEAVGAGAPEKILQEVMERRVKNLAVQVEKARADQADSATDPAVEASREETRKEIGKRLSEWDWIYKARAEKDLGKADGYYREAVNLAPGSASILGNYANFLAARRKDNDRAEELYQNALAADPNHANNLNNYAVFLKDRRKDYDRAEEFYLKALAADPNHANTLGNYALFLQERWKDYDRAEEFYQKALAADPNHAGNLSNYAELLTLKGVLNVLWRHLRRCASADSLREPGNVPRVAAVLWMAGVGRSITLQDVGPILGALKAVVTTATYESTWDFNALIAWIEKQSLPTGDAAFWIALARVCATTEVPATLDGFAQWRDAVPTPLEVALRWLAEIE